jgi:hypothetical protein
MTGAGIEVKTDVLVFTTLQSLLINLVTFR